ncbi:hypothetical protein ACQ4PT_037587 [Festuca glaucescens]
MVAWLAPLFAHLGRPTYMGPPGSGQSSKIANQIAVAGAVVGLGESLGFADAAGLDALQFLGTISKGGAGSRVLSRDFVSGGAVRYIIKNLGMALEIRDGQEEVNVLPGSNPNPLKNLILQTESKVLWPIEGTNFTSAGMYKMHLLLVDQQNLLLLALPFNISRTVGSAAGNEDDAEEPFYSLCNESDLEEKNARDAFSQKALNRQKLVSSYCLSSILYTTGSS